MEMKASRVGVPEAGREAEPGCGMSRYIPKECAHAVVVKGIEGAAESIVVEVFRLYARADKTLRGLGLEEGRHEVEALVDEAQAVEDHSFNRLSDRNNPFVEVLRDGLVDLLPDLEFVVHGGDEAEVIENLALVLHRFR